MTVDQWSGTNNWINSADWSTGAEPTSTETAQIQSGTVNLSTISTTVAGVAISSDAILAVTGPGSLTDTGGLTNFGTLDQDSGSGEGGATLSASEINNFNSIIVGNSTLDASTMMTVGTLANSGQINLYGNATAGTTKQATLDLTGSAPTTLAGQFALNGDALLEMTAGITAIGANGELELDGAQARFSVGTGTTNSGLDNLASNAGTYDQEGDSSSGAGGSRVTTTGDLYNSGVMELDHSTGDGGSSMTIGGTLTNAGSLSIGNSSLSANDGLKATTGLTNTGSVDVQGNAASGTADEAYLVIGTAAPATLSESWTVSGDAQVDFTDGGLVQTIASGAGLELNGMDARFANGALSDLGTVDGTLTLQGDNAALGAGGAILTTSVGLTNNGAVNVDFAGGGSRLTVGGTLTNWGTLDIGNDTLSANDGVTATTGLTNNDSIDVQGNAASGTSNEAYLVIGAAAPTTLSGNWQVSGDAQVDFTGGGSVQTINDGLELDGADAHFATGNLSDLSTVDGSLTLQGDNAVLGAGGARLTTSVGLINDSSVDVDTQSQDGGSALTIGGTLTNSGALLDIGNAALSASDGLTATTGLTNSGSIDVQGNATGGTTDKAYLVVGAAAPATLTAQWQVSGDAEVDFTGGGSVQTIGELSAFAKPGYLELDGAGAQFAGGTLSNLSTIVGTLFLEGDNATYGAGGAKLTTDVGLTIAGGVYVDEVSSNGGSGLTVGGTLTNTGSMYIGNGALSASDGVKATTGLTNTGQIILYGNATSGTTDKAYLVVGAAAPTTLSGSWTVGGDAEVDFTGGGSVQTIAAGADLELDGAAAQFAGGTLSNLATVDGDLQLQGNGASGAGGVSLTTGVSLTVAAGGTVDVDTDPGAGGSNFDISGVVTNDGSFSIGNDSGAGGTTVTADGLINNATMVLSGLDTNESELAVKGGATNTGNLSILPGGDLDVTGGNAYTQTGGTTTVAGSLEAQTLNANGGLVYFDESLFDGVGPNALDIGAAGTLQVYSVGDSHTVTFEAATGVLDLSAPGSFAGTIAGFSGADVIDLLATTVTGVSFSNGTLTVVNGATTEAVLTLSGSYTSSSFAFGSDGNGGTYIIDPPSGGASKVASKTATLVQAMASFGNDHGGNNSPLTTIPSLGQDYPLANSAHA